MKKILCLVLVLCLALAFAACGESKEAAAPAEKVSGSFTGSAEGMHGDVTVTIELTDSAITGCTAEAPDETKSIGQKAAAELAEAVAAEGTLGVDAVSGATITSDAFFKAAEQAITSAGLDVKSFK